MAGFELSERWCGWTDLDVIFGAARAAIEAGPFDPPICEIVFDEEFDPIMVDTFEEARAHMSRGRVHSMEIIVSHFLARLVSQTGTLGPVESVSTSEEAGDYAMAFDGAGLVDRRRPPRFVVLT